MFELAISSMWGVGRFPNFADFFRSANALGFTRFELNHAVNSAMLKGVELNGYRIPSVHEPCPADIAPAELKQRDWLISALDEENRRQGVRAVERSIDLARELGARAVIVHPGRVDMDTAPETALRRLYDAGKSPSREYMHIKGQLMRTRAAQAERNVRAVRRSLGELAEYAARAGVQLGLENRYHYFEIPTPDELDALLSLGHGVIGYWYDVGHAQTLDRLGFCAHEEWLRRFASHIIGVHLHDVVGLQDHRAAGSGEVDWAMVARYLPADALRTCEFQNNNSPQQVVDGVRWLVKQGGIIAK